MYYVVTHIPDNYTEIIEGHLHPSGPLMQFGDFTFVYKC